MYVSLRKYFSKLLEFYKKILFSLPLINKNDFWMEQTTTDWGKGIFYVALNIEPRSVAWKLKKKDKLITSFVRQIPWAISCFTSFLWAMADLWKVLLCHQNTGYL